MGTIPHMLSRGVEHLIGRFSGPLNFRLFVMPTVVTILAIRAGLRDAREGHPAFLWALLTMPTHRPRLLGSAMKDIGRIFVVAVVMDATYQLFVLHAFYLGQLLLVAVGCAIVPYIIIRGPITRLTRRLYQKKAEAAQAA